MKFIEYFGRFLRKKRKENKVKEQTYQSNEQRRYPELDLGDGRMLIALGDDNGRD